MRSCKATKFRRYVEIILAAGFFAFFNDSGLNAFEFIGLGAFCAAVALPLLYLLSCFTEIKFNDCFIIIKKPMFREKKIHYADIGFVKHYNAGNGDLDSITLYDVGGKRIVSINSLFSNYYSIKRVLRKRCKFEDNDNEKEIQSNAAAIEKTLLSYENRGFDAPIKKICNLCEEYIDDGYYNIAIKLAEGALEHKKSERLYYLLAQALMLNGQINECRKVINDCLPSYFKNKPELYKFAGEFALYDGKYDEARRFFSNLDDGRTALPGVEMQAICFYKKGLHEDAERLLDGYIKNENWEIKQNAFLIKLEMNLIKDNLKEAKAVFKKFTSLFYDADFEIKTRKALFDVLCNRIITGRVRVSLSYSPLYCLIDALIWPVPMLHTIDETCYGSLYEMYWRDRVSYTIISKTEAFICYSLHYWLRGLHIDAKEIANDGIHLLKAKNGEIDNLNNPKDLCEIAFLYLLADQRQEAEYYLNLVKNMRPCGTHLCAECHCANIVEMLMYARYNDYEKSRSAFMKLPDFLKHNYLLKRILRKAMHLKTDS